MADSSFAELKPRLRGELLQPGDLGYEVARRVYNGMIDRRPAAVARCADIADIIHSVHYARENGILVAIRGGGHNGGGLGTCDDGLVIDLSRMRGIRVDQSAGTVRVDGGCVWADVDHATHVFGQATPSGMIASTGVAGLTLGGGIGHLTRRYGLTIDNLLSADVVLADGSLVTASEDHNVDLFWALRGGGGNFGVVTSFLFRTHPVSTVYAGPTLWPVERGPDVLSWYREFLPAMPEELSGFFAYLVVPPAPMFPTHLHMRKMCGVVWSYTGALEDAEAVFRPIRAFGPPALEMLGPMPFPVLQSMFDALYQPGMQWYWRADFFKELSDAFIAANADWGPRMPTMFSTTHIYPINGAAQRVGKNDTAFSYRDASWAQVVVGVDPDPANKESISEWAKSYWDAVHPYSAGGGYVNFMMDEGQDRVRSSYRDNYPRLAAVKKKYDPANLFRVNQNIRPAEDTQVAAR